MYSFFTSRHSLAFAILVLYLLPFLGFLAYISIYMGNSLSPEVFGIGLLVTAACTLIFFLLVGQKERKQIAVPVNEESAPASFASPQLQESFEAESAHLDIPSNNTEVVLLQEVEKKNNEINYLETQLHKLQEDLEIALKNKDEEQLSLQKEAEKCQSMLADSQQTIAEQRTLIEQKHQHITQLEVKVRDLTYEIKTLLQLAEFSSQPTPSNTDLAPAFYTPEINASEPSNLLESPEQESAPSINQVHNESEAIILLKRCIDIAQKITGANYYNRAFSRLRDISVDNYALDLRRLFDSLRSENAGTVFFYSQKENRLLFVNNQVKNLLGWNSEKFLQNFPDLISKGSEEWKNAIFQLGLKNETKVALLIKAKSGQDMPLQALLGNVPTGLFRNHIIGVFYEATA